VFVNQLNETVQLSPQGLPLRQYVDWCYSSLRNLGSPVVLGWLSECVVGVPHLSGILLVAIGSRDLSSWIRILDCLLAVTGDKSLHVVCSRKTAENVLKTFVDSTRKPDSSRSTHDGEMPRDFTQEHVLAPTLITQTQSLHELELDCFT